MNWQGMYVSFQMENAGIIKHIFNLVKRLYKADCRLSVLKKMQLKKNNIYRLQIFDRADEILEDLMILNDTGLHSTPPYKWVRSEKNARAYLQGCFLAGGSVNSPKTTNYHCEIAVANAQLAGAIAKQMERFYLPARVIERKSLWIVYMKAGDKIADFLRLCSASNALFQFEDSRIQRDFYNQLTRLDNCEVANEMKAFKAANASRSWRATGQAFVFRKRSCGSWTCAKNIRKRTSTSCAMKCMRNMARRFPNPG